MLAVLTLVFSCHAIDRGMPNILLEPIRHEFHLNDKQLGLFSGLGYALAFSVTILPMGFVSDRVNRRNFLAGILLAWSLCTALGGLTRSFFQLVLARLGVGAAESGAAPVALPMVADIFPARMRAGALGLVYISSALGVLGAGVVGGAVAQNFGWRAAFFVAGAPGLVLALLLMTTVREPRRGGSEAPGAAPESPPRLREAFTFLAATPGLICLIAACALMGMVAITMGAWIASFLIRIHHLDLRQAGLVLGLAGSVGGFFSPPGLGWLADRVGRIDSRGPLWLVAAAALLSAACGGVMLFTASLPLTIAMLLLGDTLRLGYPPPCYAVLMGRTPVRLRGTVMSIMQLTTNIVGFGLGPLLVGALSDLYGAQGGLRYAMANALGLLVVAAGLLVLSAWMLDDRRTPRRGRQALAVRSPPDGVPSA